MGMNPELSDSVRSGLTQGFLGAKWVTAWDHWPMAFHRATIHQAKLRRGVDPTSLNRLADELESEAILRKVRRKLVPRKLKANVSGASKAPAHPTAATSPGRKRNRRRS